jgi:hypothetical protein
VSAQATLPGEIRRLAASLHVTLQPSQGQRPGRPTNPNWDTHRKIPMSAMTLTQLESVAAAVSSSERRVSPMQVAAVLLEQAVAKVDNGSKGV